MIWWENSLGFFTHVIAPIYPKNLTQIIARHEERKIIVKYLRKSRKRKTLKTQEGERYWSTKLNLKFDQI